MEKLKEGFFHSVMSVDETRVSVLMLSLIATLVFGGYMYLITGALSAVWADIITTLILAVAGINAVNAVTSSGKLNSVLNKTNNAPTQENKTTSTVQNQQLKK